jgi:hypothetical protein
MIVIGLHCCVSIYLNLILTKEAVIETGISDFGAGDWWS